MCGHRASPGAAGEYRPRHAQGAVLYRAVSGWLETFLARARARDRAVPRFVESELRSFLACGIAAHGFLRVHCDACGLDRIVPFACKGRAFCPSCGGRRMADTAAHLVDRVFPPVPVRQWVLTLPVALRYRLAFDGSLTTEVLHIFMRALFASLRRRARMQRPIRYAQPGAVTFVQRFGDAINLNVHFHVLALDGVFDADDSQALEFIALSTPTDEEIRRVLERFARSLKRLMDRRGMGTGAEADGADPLPLEEPLLAEIAAASARGRSAMGPRPGQRPARLGDRIDVGPADDAPLPGCTSQDGITLHAAVCVPARDRRRLERLCRYAGRPALSTKRLSEHSDGRLVYRLRHPWRDGTTHMLFHSLELIERLAVLVPPPRFHMVRFHGILAPAAGWRDVVVPVRRDPTHRQAAAGAAAVPTSTPNGGSARPAPDNHSAESTAFAGPTAPTEPRSRHPSTRPRLPWAQLLARVFEVEALRCSRCGHNMRILAAIESPDAIRAILDCLGLPSRPPPIAPPLQSAFQEDASQSNEI